MYVCDGKKMVLYSRSDVMFTTVSKSVVSLTSLTSLTRDEDEIEMYKCHFQSVLKVLSVSS